MNTLLRTSKLLHAVLFTALLSACGDPITDPTYRGTPLFEFEGQVEVQGIFPPGQHDIRLAIFWLPEAGKTPPSMWREQPSTSIRVRFPSTFAIKIFQPPRPEDFLVFRQEQAVGRLMLYEDLNGDGQRTRDEPFVGEAPNQGVVYAREDSDGSGSFTSVAIPKGFNLINFPIRCYSRIDRTQDVICKAPLGAPCTSWSECCGPDGDCSEYGGVCLMENDGVQRFPRGYCAARLEHPGCRQFSGRVPPSMTLGRPLDVRILGRTGRLILEQCTSNEDCRQDYYCDPAHRVCLPDVPVSIVLNPDYEPTEICVDPDKRTDP
jgi:hypothetical protein